MQSLGNFLANNPIGAMLRVFVGLVLGYFVLDLTTDGKIDVSMNDLNTWVAGALVVAIPILIAAINPQDTRFGAKGGTPPPA